MSLRFARQSILNMAACALASALAGCGSCPPARHTAATPERTETQVYRLQVDGTVRSGDLTTSSVHEVTCNAQCLAAFRDATVPCQQVCNDVKGGGGEVQSCTIDAGRITLQCVVHFAAQPEVCSCSVLDC
jgi:hypothetical protein